MDRLSKMPHVKCYWVSKYIIHCPEFSDAYNLCQLRPGRCMSHTPPWFNQNCRSNQRLKWFIYEYFHPVKNAQHAWRVPFHPPSFFSFCEGTFFSLLLLLLLLLFCFVRFFCVKSFGFLLFVQSEKLHIIQHLDVSIISK